MVWPDPTGLLNDLKKENYHYSLHFSYLPAYADFLLKNKVKEFALHQLNLVRSLGVPLFKYFEALPEKDLIERGEAGAKKLFGFLAANKANEYIDDALETWLLNRLPFISKEQVVPEDVSLISFIRRKSLRDFLKFYTSDVELFTNIMEEVDRLTTGMDTRSFKTVLLLQQDLYRQTQAMAHIGHWEWDLLASKLTWSDEVYRIYELEPQSEIPADLASFNHPDDAPVVTQMMKHSRETLAPHDFFYRVILKSGHIKFLHAKGQVQANDRGEPVKMFGTLQDVTSQKETEAELYEKQNFVQKITNLTPSLITVYNINTGQYLFVNDALQTLLGHSPEEVKQKGVAFFMNLLHPDDSPLITQQNAKALEAANESAPEQESIVQFVYRLRHKDGTYRWMRTFGTVFTRDDAGQVENVINVSIDVTVERERVEQLRSSSQEIRRNEERYHKMVDEVQDYAILLLNRDGIIQNWNKGAEKIKGYTAEEVVGKSFRIFYPPEDRKNQVPEKFLQAALTHGRAGLEGWRVRKDGSKFWGNIVLTSLHNENNEVIGFTKVTRDLTERRLAEEELRRNEERYHKMIDEVEDYAILGLSPEGIIQNWNKGAQKIKGYSADEIIGKSFRVFYTAADQEKKVPENLLLTARKHGKATLEGWRVRKDGTKFWGNVVLTSLHDGNNNVIGFTKVTRDLTERKEAEDILRQNARAMEQKNIELQQKNKELESFSYIASHDLQEPLRKIMLFSKRIEEKEQLTESSRDYFARIIAASTRMQTLIDALLNFASVNTFEDKFELSSLNEIVEEVKKDLSESIAEKDAKFLIGKLPSVRIIRLQFQQLFNNILSNAIKYSRPEVKPCIEISGTMVTATEVNAPVPGTNFHCITISDNGIGFEQQYADRIFEPFQRLHGKKEYSGAGIGLAICKKIVSNHNGFISAESQPGEGATFKIFLPAD